MNTPRLRWGGSRVREPPGRHHARREGPFASSVVHPQLLSVPARRAAFREQVTTMSSRLRTRTDREQTAPPTTSRGALTSGREEEPVPKLLARGGKTNERRGNSSNAHMSFTTHF